MLRAVVRRRAARSYDVQFGSGGWVDLVLRADPRAHQAHAGKLDRTDGEVKRDNGRAARWGVNQFLNSAQSGTGILPVDGAPRRKHGRDGHASHGQDARATTSTGALFKN